MTTPKLRVDGAERTEPIEDTLGRVLPHASRVGLTRLADVTGLDRIGIPVILSVRPNSSSLSVDAGKGATAPAAIASAVMECFERHAAEVATFQSLRLSYEAVAKTYRVPPVEQLPLARHGLFSRSRPEEWVLARDLFVEEEVAVPAQIVSLARHRHAASAPLPFQVSSNGLSAGNSYGEALLGGLLEVVERDAFACQRLGWEWGGRPAPRIDPATIHAPVARRLLDLYADAQIEVAVFDLEIDTRVPVFMAQIWDLRAPELGVYRGYGAHLDPDVAVVRALTEAAQSRLVYIAGSRDDSLRHQRALRRTNDLATVTSIESHPVSRDFGERASEATGTVEGDVAILGEKLREAGVEQVLAIDISEPGLPVTVVRVIAPGLEGYVFDAYRPGPRALAYAEAA